MSFRGTRDVTHPCLLQVCSRKDFFECGEIRGPKYFDEILGLVIGSVSQCQLDDRYIGSDGAFRSPIEGVCDAEGECGDSKEEYSMGRSIDGDGVCHIGRRDVAKSCSLV